MHSWMYFLRGEEICVSEDSSTAPMRMRKLRRLKYQLNCRDLPSNLDTSKRGLLMPPPPFKDWHTETPALCSGFSSCPTNEEPLKTEACRKEPLGTCLLKEHLWTLSKWQQTQFKKIHATREDCSLVGSTLFVVIPYFGDDLLSTCCAMCPTEKASA
eukprot:TRINITY_DN68045_c3_g2_i3.p1 TRINITY_DN68045_c3_g2~~TRINITY_DN68045_c3_g2_i3.p1  ORF type:complete len:157 (+),score=20.57 TRINITY_DN68045_c3_g2_i3:199-669(+)